jgi:xylan 1,4-beta-xylosidase
MRNKIFRLYKMNKRIFSNLLRFMILPVFLLQVSFDLISQPLWQKTYCNPVDIGYRYNFEQLNEKISYRSGADPVIVNHRGEYYMFVTISGGWWHSKDLLRWDYIIPDKWPLEDMCAPASLSVRDTLYLFQSTFDARPIFISTTPWNGHLIFYNRLLPKMTKVAGPWDPDIYHDEDTDRWFMYWGSSNLYPIYGIELDKQKHLTYIGDAKKLIYLNPTEHGWERFGRDHRDTIKPFIEGAWMTKYNGKYYLQYGAPGTEYNVYANGTYIGDDPLGPFTYVPYNPVSYKPGGFVQGAGHGNTFQDNYGNWWNTGTPWIAINWNFERRIAMFPAGFDSDGQMFSNTRFGDFPHWLPTKKWQSKDDLFTGWMLLSYKKTCTASGMLGNYSVNNVTDENPRTYWVAPSKKPGEWIVIDLQKELVVKAVQINYTDYKSNIYDSDSTVYTQFRIYVSDDGKAWNKVADNTGEKRDRPNAYVELQFPAKARFVKFEHIYVGAANLAVSDIRIFGNGLGKAPVTPGNLQVTRDKDPRNCFLKWDKSPGAVGYNILWGIGKEKLYQSYQRFADEGESLEIRALNVGQDYYFAIEAFNENGVSKPGGAVHIK